MKKFLSILLTVAMLATMFATMVLPAAAEEVGTMENPDAITLAVGGTATVTVAAGGEYYVSLTLPAMYQGYLLTITGETGFRYGSGMMPAQPDTAGEYVAQVSAPYGSNFTLINTTESEQTYTLALADLPAGSSFDNPEVITEMKAYKVTEILDPTQGYFYKYVAAEAGDLTITMDDADGWTYSVTNNTTSYATDTHWSDDDPVVASETLSVNANDEILIVVNAYNSVDTEVNWTLSFEAVAAVGTIENPASITLAVGGSETVTVPAGGEYYVSLNLPAMFQGYLLTVTGETGFRYGSGMMPAQPDTAGEYVAQVSAPYSSNFTLINTTESEQTYTLSLANLPAGSSFDNPEVITEMKAYKVTDILDPTQGYFYKYIATAAGDLTITMDDADGWTYSVTNNTTSAATDTHWSDDDPVVSSETIAVSEGDEILIVVNAYNSVDTEVNWTLSFKEAEDAPEVGTMENPASITLAVGGTATVTVPAGGEYYVSLNLPAMYTGYILTVSGETGFRYGSGMMPAQPDTNGEYVAQVSAPYSSNFTLINTTESEQTYTLSLANLPAGSSYDNPEIITNSGDYKVTEIVDPFQGYFYQFTAPSAGTITVSMNDVDGWTYSITNNTTSVATDQHWCDDDPIVSYEKMEVAEGDVIIIVVNAYESTDTEVNWNFTFEEAEVTNYATSDTLLQVGTNDYTVDASYAYTVYTFQPSEIGKYTISSNNAVLGIVSTNGMWITVEPSAETITANSAEWECQSVGQSIWVAVMADTNVATITISKEDITIVETPVNKYENTKAPESFTFEGDASALENVDIDDDVVDTAVLGEDGFYHLNSAEGPILYVNLSDEAMSLIDAAGYGQLTDVIYDGDTATSKTDYNEALLEYAACVDTATGLYPLTADLIEILQKVGEEKSWYGETGWLQCANEDAWMFACYYAPADVEGETVLRGDINGNGKIDGRDYLLLKRAYFKTYTLTCDEAVADINGNDKLDPRDYLLLKRAYFGTYKIPEDLANVII